MIDEASQEMRRLVYYIDDATIRSKPLGRASCHPFVRQDDEAALSSFFDFAKPGDSFGGAGGALSSLMTYRW